jgi:hypothetical protein
MPECPPLFGTAMTAAATTFDLIAAPPAEGQRHDALNP